MLHKTALGVVGALAGAIAGAVIWAIITATTNFQIGYMAVLVGFLAGLGMRTLGGKPTVVGAYAAAAIGLFGCVLGNLMTAGIEFAKHDTHAAPTAIAALMLMHPDMDAAILHDSFNIMDLLFYGIAVYTAYKTALRAPGPSRYGAAPPRSYAAPDPEVSASANE